MNGITEPLPGLLDDPQFQFTDLPALTDFQIAPLRNPAPSRHANVPLPLEPVAGNIINNSNRTAKGGTHGQADPEKRRAPSITPNDVLLAREAKKPHLAISELLEDNDGPDNIPSQLPSFISLSVVEKSPIQTPSPLERGHSQKRLRLDSDHDSSALEMIRHLPRPAQKDELKSRPAPLLPAMVTGLHEPPPSAALLPSIDVESRPAMPRSAPVSKMHVKDILTESDPTSTLPPVLPNSATDKQPPPTLENINGHNVSTKEPSLTPPDTTAPAVPWKDNKPRRARRKWTESETRDLLAGVKKYGIGKWKQILDDCAFNFSERSSVDLKDRYRVCANNDSFPKTDSQPHSNTSGTDQPVPDSVGPSLSPKANEIDLVGDNGQPAKQRRKRRAWTIAEDDNLLKGVARHGFQWTAIHDDPELELSHRRATDLRDRIRNKFPDGYKHAETAPLRSEIKKAEKLAVSTPNTSAASMNHSTPATKHTLLSESQQSIHSMTPTKSGSSVSARGSVTKVKSSTSATSLTMLLHSEEDLLETSKEKTERQKDRDRDKDHQQTGVTLPSFTLEVDDHMDWEDNRLPPLHEWDEIGI